MLRVGLTGGIACGKSVVASVFECRGAYLHRADQASHRLMNPGGPAWAAVRDRFGARIVSSDGTIDRKALGAVVFRSTQARRDLEKILHPLVLADLRTTAAKAAAGGRVRIFVSEAALIYETGLEEFFDRVVVVRCDKRTQKKRLMERDGITAAEADRRLKAQMDPAEKARRADYVIVTSGALEETLARAEAVFTLLLDESSKPSNP
jgi:dephospho-CoA kinase